MKTNRKDPRIKAHVVRSAKLDPDCEGCKAARFIMDMDKNLAAQQNKKIRELDKQVRELRSNTLRFNSPSMEVPEGVKTIWVLMLDGTMDLVAHKDGEFFWMRRMVPFLLDQVKGWLPADKIKVEVIEDET